MPTDFDLDDLDEETESSNEGMTEAQLIKQAQETGDVTPLVRHLRGVIKNSKKENKTLQQQVQESAKATKKLAFIEAKLPDEPQVKFFLDHYEGEYTADAIRAAAAEHGFIPVETNEQHQEMENMQTMMNASQGGNQIAAPGTDAELTEKINAVPPGPDSAKKIAGIMRAAGRLYEDE